jgi:hypothetical protein
MPYRKSSRKLVKLPRKEFEKGRRERSFIKPNVIDASLIARFKQDLVVVIGLGRY